MQITGIERLGKEDVGEVFVSLFLRVNWKIASCQRIASKRVVIVEWMLEDKVWKVQNID